MATLGDCDSIQTNLTEPSGRRPARASTSNNQSNEGKINTAAVVKLADKGHGTLPVPPPTALPQKQSIVHYSLWWKRQVA